MAVRLLLAPRCLDLDVLPIDGESERAGILTPTDFSAKPLAHCPISQFLHDASETGENIV